MKLSVHFCVGIAGLAPTTVIFRTMVSSELLLLVNAVFEGVFESQPNETLMYGTTFDCLLKCHLKVILHVKSTASFSATDRRGAIGSQTGFESEIQ